MNLGRAFIYAYLLNFVWESVQMPLYGGYEGFWAHVPMHLLASLVDALVTLVLIALVQKFRRKSTAKFAALAIGGGVMAIIFEYSAQALGLWSYGSNMPLVGGVGLLPLLQLTLLVPVASWLSCKERKAV